MQNQYEAEVEIEAVNVHSLNGNIFELDVEVTMHLISDSKITIAAHY